jgi:translation initiation factor IF-3
MKLSEAIKRAQGLGLDLVEVAPTANPPVCKIVDFGKFRYDISKQEKDKKASGTKLKEIKFRVNIDDHDYLTKIRHGEQFLDRGNKVRVQLQFRGREMAHQEFGMQLMHKVRDDLATMAQVEMEPKAAGRELPFSKPFCPSSRAESRDPVELAKIDAAGAPRRIHGPLNFAWEDSEFVRPGAYPAHRSSSSPAILLRPPARSGSSPRRRR